MIATKVFNMESNKGNKVANQFLITTDEAFYFQSYNSIIAKRTNERLGESDRGVILFRKQIEQQLAIMQDGGDPMNVIRDQSKNRCIELPLERWPALQETSNLSNYIPAQVGESEEQIAKIERLLASWAEYVPDIVGK